MKISKDALTIIIPTALIVIMFYLLNIIVISIIALIFLCFTIYFFRDPMRISSDDPSSIISPADGKVVTIDEINVPDNSDKKMKRIGIFMSIFDVHINRSPFIGSVIFLKYNKGKFLNALNNKSSEVNENNIIGIDIGGETIFVKQIAGIIARRIVCKLKIGDEIKKGEKIGMIKYGSRVEVFIPTKSKITVNLNDKVKAGETIIGSLK